MPTASTARRSLGVLALGAAMFGLAACAGSGHQASADAAYRLAMAQERFDTCLRRNMATASDWSALEAQCRSRLP